jgi:DNA-binding MarR family transcriptional regulator
MVMDKAEPEVDRRLATLWQEARFGPTIERIREHVFAGGEEQLDFGQFRLLQAVAAHGPCPMRQLADALAITASTVTRSVQRLEAAGLVVRMPGRHDQREVFVDLTEEGRRLFHYFVERAMTTYQEIFATFTVDERVLLADMLERILKSADALLVEG